MNRNLCLSAAIILSLTLTAGAQAYTVTGTGSVSGHALSASATFDIVGSDLQITLTNTDPFSGDFSNPWGLTGLFWDSSQTLTTTGASATVPAGSSIIGTCSETDCSTVTNVGGEFAYIADVSSVSGAPAGIGANGLGSSGYLSGTANLNGPDLDSPASPDGPNFSLIGPNGTGLLNGINYVPVINDSVVFLLPITNQDFSLASLSNFSFRYGTAWSDASFNGTCTRNCDGGGSPPQGNPLPEPTTLALFGIGLLGAGFMRRRVAN